MKFSVHDMEYFVMNCEIFVEFYVNCEMSEKIEDQNLVLAFINILNEFLENYVSITKKNKLINSLKILVNYLLYKYQLKLVYEIVSLLKNEILFEIFYQFLINFNYPILAANIKQKIEVSLFYI